MLTKIAQEKLLKALRLPDDKIAEALGDAEVDVELPALHIYDDTGLTELKANIKKGHEKDYPEIYLRELNKKYELGLSAADAKDQDKVIAAMEAKALKKANIAPDAKAAEYEESKKKLQQTIDEKENEGKTWKQKYEERELNDNYRDTFFHPERNDALTDKEWVNRLKDSVGIGDDNGTPFYIDKKTGKPYKDNKENYLNADEVKEKLYAQPGWLKPKAAELPDADPKKTHRPPNPAGNQTKKYKDHDAIMKEVDRKFPKDNKGNGKLRQNYFNQLAAELA